MVVSAKRSIGGVFGLVLVAVAFGLLFPRPAKAAQAVATWVGGTGNWNVAANWSPAVVPNNGTPVGMTYKVRIDADSGTNSVVTLNGSFTIDQLTVDAGDTLSIANGNTLTLAAGGTLSNAGAIQLNSSGSTTAITIQKNTTLAGGGAVTMSNNNNQIKGTSSLNVFINQDNTIQGGGSIGADTMGFRNFGTVVANQPFGIIIDPSATGAVNGGTLRADSSGTLVLSSGTFDNTANGGGTITANTGLVILTNSTV